MWAAHSSLIFARAGEQDADDSSFDLVLLLSGSRFHWALSWTRYLNDQAQLR
jgi:hypothetical protein